MSWHGQINRTIWEISEAIKKSPDQPRQRRELLRAQFLQHFEFDKAFHIPRDDRTFLFLHDTDAPLVLLVHGATGTPAELRELGNFLYSRGISVYCPRLARLSTREKAETWESWVTQTQIALEVSTTCSPNAFVCGMSLGATISLILQDRVPLRGMILLAPALFPRMGLKARLLQVTRYITPTVFYHFAGWNGEVLKGMDYARRNLSEIKIPVLAMQAEDDRHLSLRGLRFLKRHARHPDNEIQTLETGSHVLTRGAVKTDVFAAVAAFVEKHSQGVAPVAAAPKPQDMPDPADYADDADPISDPS